MGLIVAENIGKNYQVGEIAVRALKGVSFEMKLASFVSIGMRELRCESGFQKEFSVF
jgi:hypothetical protein